MDAALLLAALLAVFPTTPARRCIEARREQIAHELARGEAEHGVPAGLMLAVAFLETHAGCASGENGNWGTPIDRRHRHVAGTPQHAARAMASSYRVCGGDWLAATRRYRSGLCAREAPRGYTARAALRRAREIYARAGLALPPGLAAQPLTSTR